MKPSHRTALSLLLTIIIFAAIALAAVFGGFRYIEMHYYQPRVVNNITKTLDSIGTSYNSYSDNLVNAFATYALDEKSRSFIERDVTSTDIENREEMTGLLMEKNPGLEGIRLIENDGNHIHYSTFSSDVLTKSEDLISYRNYSELNELPFQFIGAPDNGEYAKTVEELGERCGIYLDSVKERIIFSLPYFDKYTAHRGSLIFYVGTTEFAREIIASNIVPLNTRLKIVAPTNDSGEEAPQSTGNSGFVFGMPNVGRDLISKSVQKTWNAKRYGAEQLIQTDNGEILILVTGSQCKYGKIGWICKDSEFSFSETEKILLLLCLFITLFLIIFMLFNFKHDDTIVIRERVHKFEMALFREYLEHRDTKDWKELEKKVARRKQDVNAEIVKSLGITGKKHSKEITEALDRSWNDFMHLVSGGYKSNLENLTAATQPTIPQPVHTTAIVEADDVQELEEVEDLEEVEEIPEAESLEEVEDLEEVEELQDAEPVDDAEDIEEIEEIDAVEEVEPVEELQEIQEVGEVEEIEEIPEVENEEAIQNPLPSDSGNVKVVLEKAVEEKSDLLDNGDSSQTMKTEAKTSDNISEGAPDIEEDIQELEEIPEDEDDLGIPEVEDFVDPLEDEESPVEVLDADDLEEISPEEEAQMAQMLGQNKTNSNWRSSFLADEEIGGPSFNDLDQEDANFWDDHNSE